MIELRIPLKGMGAVRMTRRGQYVDKYAIKYKDYKKMVQIYVRNQYKGEMLTGPLLVSCDFYFSPPKSYPKKKLLMIIKKRLFFTKKPDIDNLFKGVLDSLNNVVYTDDKNIVFGIMTKQYAEEDYIDICIKELST